MIVFNPAIHNRNIGYQLARVQDPVLEFFEYLFLFVTFPFRMLHDGWEVRHTWKAGQWLAGFVALLLLVVLIGIRAGMDGDWSVLQTIAVVYFGVCGSFALAAIMLSYIPSD